MAQIALIPGPDPVRCPTDLCCYGECQCTPAERGESGRGWAMRALGVVAAALAVVDVALPVLPTTPFVLLSAWAFARSSPRLDAWLRAHPNLGPPLSAWESRRAIPVRAKALAVAGLPVSGVAVHAAGAGLPLTAAIAVLLLGVGAWILTRPS